MENPKKKKKKFKEFKCICIFNLKKTVKSTIVKTGHICAELWKNWKERCFWISDTWSYNDDFEAGVGNNKEC